LVHALSRKFSCTGQQLAQNIMCGMSVLCRTRAT
jgi:hypothetical protein